MAVRLRPGGNDAKIMKEITMSARKSKDKKYQKVLITLPPELRQQLATWCEKTGGKASTLIQWLLEEYLTGEGL